MVNEIVTRQELIDAKLDARDLGKAANEKTIVSPRYGEDFKSIPLIVEEGNQEIINLQNAIDIAAAAGAGENGWTAQLIIDGDKTQKQINESQANKNLDSFSFDDVLTQNEKNNSATTNLASKLSAVATDERILKITIKRKYLINSPVTFNRNIEIECVGDGELIFGSSGSLEFAGSATLLGKLPSNETKYTQTLNVPSGVVAGDVLGIYNPTDFSFSKHRAEYRDGQFLRVASVSSGVANTYDLLYSEYNTTCDLYKINQIDVTLRNFKFTMVGSTDSAPVVITYAKPKIYSPEYFGSNRYGMVLQGCFGGFIIDSDSKQFNASVDGYQYGVMLANCQDVRVTFGNFSGSRHGVAIGGSSIECALPNRNLNISGATITSNIENAGADSHGNSQNITYRDCVMLGVSVGGRDISVLDSVIYGRQADGTCFVFYEITGGLFQLKRCKLITAKSSNITFITTTFAPSARQQDDDTLLDDVFFDIDDISVEAENSGALSRLFRIVVQNNLELTKKINVTINNIKALKMGQLESVLHFQFATASASSSSINVGAVRVDNIINLPSSYLVRAIDSWGIGYDLKLMQQSGTQTLSTTSTTQKVLLGSTATFKYRYPVAPKVALAVSTEESTWNGDFLNNGVTVAPYNAVSPAATVRTTYIIPSLQGCSNAIPANKAFKVDWTVQV